MKITQVVTSAAFFATLLLAGLTQQANSQSTQGNKGTCPPYSDNKKFDSSPIVDAIDTNHDGKLTHEEWKKSGAPEASWNSFMSKENIKKQGYISRADFVSETPPDGVDANCDGKITLEEFLNFSKSMSNRAPSPASK